VDRN
jgi:RNA polymerase sigma factor (sigma-70 family)